MSENNDQQHGTAQLPVAAIRLGVGLLTSKVRLIILAIIAAIVAIALVAAVALVALASFMGGGQSASSTTSVANGACAPVGTSNQSIEAPAEYQEDQVTNAKLIDEVARSVGAPGEATRLAILVSIDETDLTNLDGGDRDSAGLFQQRPSQGWGTLEQVTDPEHATKSFLLGPKHDGSGGLIAVDGWQSMEPAEAAWQVQRSESRTATAEHYDEVDPILERAGLDLDYEGSGFWTGGAAPSSLDSAGGDLGASSCTTAGGDVGEIANVEGLNDLPQFPTPEGCSDTEVMWAPYGPDGLNGNVPDKNLCTIPFAADSEARVQVRPAAALFAMNQEFKAKFGHDLTVTSTYRTFTKQQEVKASKGHMAATPGWSNHGYGLAIDITLTPEEHTWMRENAIRFGWWHPLWARPNGSKPESWHWEYGSWLYDERYKDQISDDQLTYNV